MFSLNLRSMQLHGAPATRPQRSAKQILSIFASGRLSYLLKLGKTHQQFCLSEIKQSITKIGTGCSQF